MGREQRELVLEHRDMGWILLVTWIVPGQPTTSAAYVFALWNNSLIGQ
jgi:hypothetical protein